MKYVFTNGKILNGTKDMQVQEGQVILVENERITEILPAEEAGKRNLKASGYEEIDLQGKYILPGLINMHVHLAGNGKPQKKQRDNEALVKKIMSNGLTKAIAYHMVCGFAKDELYSGVTTIRTVGGLGDFDTRLRDDVAKLFRKMDISIEEMRALFEKRKSLQFCLEQHLGELERRREGLVKMQEMCERLIAEHQSLDTLNAENCLEEIEQMEKEGARFMDIKKTDIRKKRRTGAIIGAVVMILLMGFTIGLMLWANTQDPIPTGLLIFLIAIPVVIIGGILAALAGRMKEIEGGEEDEASKY